MPSNKLRNDPALAEGRRPLGQKPDKARIRELNDTFRMTFTGGRVMMTREVNELEAETKAKLVAAVRSFDRFDKGNDPTASTISVPSRSMAKSSFSRSITMTWP